MRILYCSKIFSLFTGIFLFAFSYLPKTFARNSPPPQAATISVGIASGIIYTCSGVASASPNISQFPVSGANLTSNITATAPAGFELSLAAGSGYSNTLSLTPSNGAISNVILYVRAAATAPVGFIAGNVILTAAGSADQSVEVIGMVYALPMVNKPPDQGPLPNRSATNAVNFVGNTASYTWANDNPAIGLPASGTGDIPSFTVKNTDLTKTLTATITVTPVPQTNIYIPNSQSNDVTVIDVANNKQVTIIPVGKSPLGVAVSPDGTRVYVANQSSDNISVINTVTNKVVSVITLPPGSGPSGIVVSPDGNLVYVANYGRQSISIINTATNAITGSIQLSGAFPYEIALSRDGSRLYSPNHSINGTNNISIINTATNAVIFTMAVGDQPFNACVSPDGLLLYVANTNSGNVIVINTETNKIVSTMITGLGPWRVTTNPDGSRLYVSNSNSGTVSVINTADNSILTTINVGGQPYGESFNLDGSLLYVVSANTNLMSVIDPVANKVITTVGLGTYPFGLGNFVMPETGCTGTPVKFSITVARAEPPLITVTGTLQPLQTTYGTPSAPTSFTLNGANMQAGVLVSPPPGFEVSADNSTFSNTITVGAEGTIAPTTIYIRLAASASFGSYMGNVVLSSDNAPNASIPMPASTVKPATLTITADDKNKNYGQPNPALTVTYQGFKNNDGPAQLTSLPQVTTTAVTTSPPGEYPITVSAAGADNYSITYVFGTLTVSPSIVDIPNGFTPNNDGINDTWNIQYLDTYPNCSVDIFNRYGTKVYASIGYPAPWNGRYKGANLPAGTYYYIINLHNGSPVLSGSVTILR